MDSSTEDVVEMGPAYATLTPHGVVDVFFGSDGANRFVGPDEAVQWVRDTVHGLVDGEGIGMSADTVSAHDYVDFCQPDSAGMKIIEPASVAVEREIAAAREG